MNSSVHSGPGNCLVTVSKTIQNGCMEFFAHAVLYMVKSVLMDVTTKRPDQGHGLSQHGEVHAGPDSCLITMSKQPCIHSFTRDHM